MTDFAKKLIASREDRTHAQPWSVVGYSITPTTDAAVDALRSGAGCAAARRPTIFFSGRSFIKRSRAKEITPARTQKDLQLKGLKLSG